MSSPQVLVRIVIAGAQIFGKALAAAGRQAVKNAKYRPPTALTGESEGVRNATSGSRTDILTRELRMTLDEAHLILNVKRGETLEAVKKHYEHLMKANSPPAAAPAKKPTPSRSAGQYHSHYLQSKVVRAQERIEAEMKIAEEPAPSPATTAEGAHAAAEAPPTGEGGAKP